MRRNIIKYLPVGVSLIVVSACSWLGDTDSIKKATEQAIDCQTDEALTTLSKAEQGSGLGKYLGQLERIAILREAERAAEADAALNAYMAQPESESTDRAEVESSIGKVVKNIREKRNKQTGQDLCKRFYVN